MPELIEHIDAIARMKGRDVLYLEFDPLTNQRGEVLAWLDVQGIAWQACGPFADGTLTQSCRGQIYLDVPFDEGLAEYRLLRDYLEYPDGSMRQPGVTFYAMSLKMAQRNAHHDAPGYWESIADDF